MRGRAAAGRPDPQRRPALRVPRPVAEGRVQLDGMVVALRGGAEILSRSSPARAATRRPSRCSTSSRVRAAWCSATPVTTPTARSAASPASRRPTAASSASCRTPSTRHRGSHRPSDGRTRHVLLRPGERPDGLTARRPAPSPTRGRRSPLDTERLRRPCRFRGPSRAPPGLVLGSRYRIGPEDAAQVYRTWGRPARPYSVSRVQHAVVGEALEIAPCRDPGDPDGRRRPPPPSTPDRRRGRTH